MPVKAMFIGRDEVMRTYALVAPNAIVALAGTQMKIAQELAERIRARAPVDRRGGGGRYRQSIHAARLSESRAAGSKPLGRTQQTKDPNATAVFGSFIWRFIEFGTSPHIIKAKKSPVLAFEGQDGTKMFATQVNHPGSNRQPHIFPTYRAQQKTIKRRLSRTMRNAVKKAIEQQQANEGDGA